MKKTKLDMLMTMMADPSRMAPQAILLTGVPSAIADAAAATSSANPAPSVQVPPPPPVSYRAKKGSSKRGRLEGVNVEGEEGAKEDPDADLRQKRRRREKGKEEDLVDCVLGEDAAWELDARLTSSSVRKHLQTKAEEELLAAKDQISVLKVERDSALEYLPLKEKKDSLAQQLSQKEVEHRSTIDRVAQLEEDIKLSKAREEANYWCTEWKSLGTEAKEMCQETLETGTDLGGSNSWIRPWLEIVLDQVSHLYLGVDFSAINLKTRWDLKGRRIYVPEELLGDDAEVAETLPEAGIEQQPEQGNVVGDGGECL
ncbi:hypothetical protein PIB30_049977 [Stylosanthes scabra]|uniref:Uncharacterized protein n=1 Tax=Stylosanthes scabra TaxID=79078 RepID=A0ABU6QH29_9FABA|nr:hypothetical protein [Stylosanthes scabra]